MSTETFERETVGGIRLHVMPTDRFKTFAISVYLGQPLTEQYVTPTALTPFVLRRGSMAYPETKQFRERLDDLFGAGFGFDVYKRGDRQIVQFRMDVINDQFVSAHTPLLSEAINFVGEALTKPALENERFRDKYVQAEMNTLRKRIEAVVNDKIRYAAERCIEEMCKDEPYRLYPLGKIDALEAIDADSLYAFYRDWIAKAPIDVYVVGQTTLDEVKKLISEHVIIERSNVMSYDRLATTRHPEQVNTVVERMDVGQGKLNMGLRSHVTYADELYPASLMYNGILGGFPHSKLFVNVRERASLAYYAASRMDGHKGILTIQSGIEISNYEKAVDIIKKQIDSMASGVISDLELSQTKAMISNHLREIQDSAFEMISFDFNNVLAGMERTVPELLGHIKDIAIEDIIRVAQQVELDTIYFLRDEKGE